MATRAEIMALDNTRLRQAEIAVQPLVFMDFVDAPTYWFPGWGTLEVDGQTYTGTGKYLTIPEIPASVGTTAETITFELSAATQEMISLIRDAEDRILGREVVVSYLFLEVVPRDGNVQPWSQMFSPVVMFTGEMDLPKVTAGFQGESFQGRAELPAYGMFNGRNAAANSRWTAADQRRRYDNDGGCDRMGLYAAGYEPVWFKGDE